jgi:hypothetical protein
MIFYASSDRQRRLNTRRLPMLPLLLTILVLRTSAGSGQNFFPPGVFHPDNLKVDSFVAKWYGEQLTALEEPSLFEARQDSTVQSYRFLWLRTFNHPIAIRVVIQPDGTGTLITKMANGAGGYKPGNVILNSTESLPREKGEGVLDKIRRVEYWTLSGHDANTNGRDGASMGH